MIYTAGDFFARLLLALIIVVVLGALGEVLIRAFIDDRKERRAERRLVSEASEYLRKVGGNK